MLRASIESTGSAADLRVLTDAGAAESSGVAGAAELIAWVEATLTGEPGAIAEARDRVQERLGSAALVDAAGVIANFERMVRIADGTGIPLDTAVAVATEEDRAVLGIDDFGHAGETAPVAGWQRWIGRGLQPLVRKVLRRRARRAEG